MAKIRYTRAGDKPMKRLVEIPSPDEAVLDLLHSKEINLLKQRLVHFYLYFPSQEKAEAAKTELSERSFGKNGSFEVEVIEPLEGRKEWLCFITSEIFPTSSSLTSIRKKLETLARKFDGKYDGWETGISPDEWSL